MYWHILVLLCLHVISVLFISSFITILNFGKPPQSFSSSFQFLFDKSEFYLVYAKTIDILSVTIPYIINPVFPQKTLHI